MTSSIDLHYLDYGVLKTVHYEATELEAGEDISIDTGIICVTGLDEDGGVSVTEGPANIIISTSYGGIDSGNYRIIDVPDNSTLNII